MMSRKSQRIKDKFEVPNYAVDEGVDAGVEADNAEDYLPEPTILHDDSSM